MAQENGVESGRGARPTFLPFSLLLDPGRLGRRPLRRVHRALRLVCAVVGRVPAHPARAGRARRDRGGARRGWRGARGADSGHAHRVESGRRGGRRVEAGGRGGGTLRARPAFPPPSTPLVDPAPRARPRHVSRHVRHVRRRGGRVAGRARARRGGGARGGDARGGRAGAALARRVAGVRRRGSRPSRQRAHPDGLHPCFPKGQGRPAPDAVGAPRRLPRRLGDHRVQLCVSLRLLRRHELDAGLLRAAAGRAAGSKGHALVRAPLRPHVPRLQRGRRRGGRAGGRGPGEGGEGAQNRQLGR